MPSRRLTPDTMLDVTLSAICTRNMLTSDPAPVIAELRRVAGDRHDILARVAGTVSGYYEGLHTHALCAALREQIEGAEAWVTCGVARRSAPRHGATSPSVVAGTTKPPTP